MTPDDARHETTAGYHAGCRDFCCRRAVALYEYDRRIGGILGRHLTVPSLGTARRVRALVALGWSFTDIGHHIDRSHDYARKIANQTETTIRATTAQRIAELYDRLSMQIPPETRRAAYARTVARRNGYAPPLAWDCIDTDPEPQWGGTDIDIDPVVVMRLLEGRRIESTKAEKEEAMRRWVADGGSRAELARVHGWKPERYTTGLRLVEGGAA